MARRPRLQYPGAVFHVMARGNRKGIIFEADADRETFLEWALDADPDSILGKVPTIRQPPDGTTERACCHVHDLTRTSRHADFIDGLIDPTAELQKQPISDFDSNFDRERRCLEWRGTRLALMLVMSSASTSHRTVGFSTRWVPCLVAIPMVAVMVSCSASRGPVIGPGERTGVTGGTISGTVRADHDAPLSARTVTAVNLETGQRIETSTASNGGYTVKVGPGRYRLEVELREGETVIRAPDELQISSSDLDAGRDFVIRSQFVKR